MQLPEKRLFQYVRNVLLFFRLVAFHHRIDLHPRAGSTHIGISISLAAAPGIRHSSHDRLVRFVLDSRWAFKKGTHEIPALSPARLGRFAAEFRLASPLDYALGDSTINLLFRALELSASGPGKTAVSLDHNWPGRGRGQPFILGLHRLAPP